MSALRKIPTRESSHLYRNDNEANRELLSTLLFAESYQVGEFGPCDRTASQSTLAR